ncbi:glyoxalase [Enterococcus sp. JM4C]|uniref:VOC family protein n=1 Tax=Candidatus Enterococcus huntleyi TaxID=1857217 RepID=UPI00137B1D4C|nr:VOC family protein [Enterococcus sp. JM4C]KAF1298655.1 glyoxalase [Enterococcus sp. JM4C]
MFTNQIKIMLYVDHVEESASFWKSLGFYEFERQEMDGTLIVEIGPSKDAESRFVLYDRKFIEAHSPEVALNSPSIMFASDDIISLYKKMQEQKVVMGDLVQLGEEMVFNFSDNDGNYFAVSGK